MPQGYELFIIVGLVVLLFGGSQLPKLARSIGQAQKEFKSGLSEAEEDDKKDDVADSSSSSSA